MVKASVPRKFSLRVGAFFILEGVCELFSPVVFGIFSSKPAHGLLHLLLGAAGVAASATHAGKFLSFLGILLLLIAALWFIPGTRHVPEDLFNANSAVAIFDVLLGA